MTHEATLRSLYKRNKGLLSILLISSAAIAGPAQGQSRPFSLVGPADAPVCRAYLSALNHRVKNSQEFRSAPWCDRDINPSVEGFPALRRIYITDPVVASALHTRIQSFLTTQDQFGAERRMTGSEKESRLRGVQGELKSDQLRLWHYEGGLDLDNDGQPENVLWYRHGRCDSTRPAENLVVVLNREMDALDEERTRHFFAEPRPYPIRTERFIPLRGGATGVFRYKDRDYIEAWGDDQAWGGKPGRLTAQVYMRVRTDISKVCEVEWNQERGR